MVFFSNAPVGTEPQIPLSSTFPDTESTVQNISSNPAIANILGLPEIGEFKREMLTWRTPHLGYVQMYINPQNLTINDTKVINAERTKGGYTIQYAGEGLTEIDIDGTTGSGGIEGINILRSIYRSEQEAFESIATNLEESLANLQLNTISNNILEQSPLSDLNIFSIANDVFRNFGRPQPTLASLASNIELFFQGELYRGFFTKFYVSEKASEPGWFDYRISFTAYARQGRRRNFMPWHRQPINPANVNANPLSFTGAADILNASLAAPQTPNDTVDVNGNNPPPPISPALPFPFNRSTSTATGLKGLNIRSGSLGV
jgi:hypothetical protein